MSKPIAAFVFLIVAGLFACFFLWPITATLGGAFLDADGKWTWQFVAEVFRNRIYLEGLRNALLLAIASTVASVAVALPLAWLADRVEFPGKRLLSGLLLVPMILPPFVGAIGLRQIFGQYGAFNALLTKLGVLSPEHVVDWLGAGRFWGIVALNALHLYPILYLNISAALANVDPAMEEAAENLGCVGMRKFRKITLPLIAPGVFAGGIIVFIFAFTELGAPLVFDYTRVTAVQIFYGIKEIAGNPFPFALVTVMLISTLLLYAVSRLAFSGHPGAMSAKATIARRERQATSSVRWWSTIAFAAVVALALLPHLGVILMSVAGDWYRSVLPHDWTLEHYRAAIGHPLTVPSIVNSLKYASLSTLLDLALGLGIAYVLVRTAVPGRWMLDTLAMLPLAVPGLVLAFGYVSVTQEGRALAFLNPTKDPTPLLVIAYAVRRLPYVVRSAVAGLQQTSVTLEEAAQNLGAPPFRVLGKITLPLVSANLIAGGLLAFAFAMLEVSDSLVLAQKQQHFPITKAIYELFQIIGEGRFLASALGVWSMVFLGVTLLAASRILGRRLGALFRM